MSADDAQPQQTCGDHWKRWKPWIIKNYLVLGFIFVITLALSWPLPGRELGTPMSGDFPIAQTCCIVVIFFISGLTLKTADIKKALGQRAALAYGIITILFVTPMLGFALVQIPFEPVEFRYGLALFACVPTTLTSGVTLVTSALGNGVMALMLTVTTNVLGVFTVPFILNAVLLSAPGGDSGGADTDMAAAAAKLLLKLVISIIIPMAVGKGTREFVEQAPKLTTKYKTELGLTNNSCLIAIVWMSISKSRGKLVRESALNIFVIVVAGVTLHMFFLAMNWVMTTPVLRLPEAERRAVLLMTSQKTLPVAVTIIAYLDETRWGGHGLIAIPCIVGHVSQLFIDAYIASIWAGKDPKGIDAANAAKRAGGVVEEAESRAENGVSSEARVGVAGDTKA
jgi:sodium/bile acid cotransporter 7